MSVNNPGAVIAILYAVVTAAVCFILLLGGTVAGYFFGIGWLMYMSAGAFIALVVIAGIVVSFLRIIDP